MDDVIYDMKQTPDGGFVIAGELDDDYHYYHNTTQQGWLLKVDSCGCASLTDPQCHPDTTTNVRNVVNVENVKVWPNPAHNIISVGYKITNTTDAVLQVSDVTGREITTVPLPANTTKTTIDCHAWSAGVYIYKVLQNGMMAKAGKVVVD